MARGSLIIAFALLGCSSTAAIEPGAGGGAMGSGGGGGDGGAALSDALYPPSARFGDGDFVDWAKAWFRWMTAIPGNLHPAFGGDCTLQQPTDVFFLVDAGEGQLLDLSCTVPADRPLFVPVITIICTPEPTGEDLCSTPSTGDDLLFCISGAVAKIADAWVVLDGVPLEPLEPFLVVSDVFSWQGGDPPPFWWAAPIPPNDCGIPEGDRFGAIGGIWVALRQLSPGPHTLDVGGIANAPATTIPTGVRFSLTVASSQ